MIFENGQEREYDSIIFCTGFRFDLPFLDDELVCAPDNHELVKGLVDHLFHKTYSDGSLSFVGVTR